MAAWIPTPYGGFMRQGAKPPASKAELDYDHTNYISPDQIKSVDGDTITLKSDSGPDGHPTISISTGQQGSSGQPFWHKALEAAPALLLGGVGIAGALGAGGGAAAGAGAADAAGGAAGAGTAAAGAGAAGAGAGGVGGVTGALSAASKIAGIGKAVSALAGGAASGRLAEGTANIQASDAANRIAQTGISSANAGENFQNDDYHQMVRAAILKGLQDATVTPPPGIPMGTITGGLRPSAISGKDPLADLVTQRAQADLNHTGDPNVGLTALSRVKIPNAPTFPNAGPVSTAMGMAGPLLQLLPSFLKNTKNPMSGFTGFSDPMSSFGGSYT